MDNHMKHIEYFSEEQIIIKKHTAVMKWKQKGTF